MQCRQIEDNRDCYQGRSSGSSLDEFGEFLKPLIGMVIGPSLVLICPYFLLITSLFGSSSVLITSLFGSSFVLITS